MAEEIKTTQNVKSDMAKKFEDFNLRLALTYAVAFGIGVCAGAYLALSGFFA